MVENSANIRGPISSPEIQAFATGFGDGPIRSPSHVAWLLESAALEGGWQANDVLGSETDLLERFAASRDVVRGAIRIVEARGSMKMRRGCQGGLHLQIPSVESAGVALAIYLRSHSYALLDIQRTAAVIGSLLPRSGTGQAIKAVIQHSTAILSDGKSLSAGSGNRAEIFAMRIIDRADSPLPEGGVYIGTEAQLCSEFGLAHRTFRQALNILEDLEILKVRQGRGGGYLLKPASAMGVIRRIFVLLASRQVAIAEANETLWKLGTARLRILFDPARGLTQEGREQWARAVLESMKALPEPRRWVHLQHAIDDLADDRLIKTLASAMIAYVARTGSPPASHEPVENRLWEAEQGVIDAICCGRSADAERHLQAGQEQLSSLNGLHDAAPDSSESYPC